MSARESNLSDFNTEHLLTISGWCSAMELEYVRGLANGDIDPLSKLAMIDINPDAFSPSKVSSAELQLFSTC